MMKINAVKSGIFGVCVGKQMIVRTYGKK